MLLLAPLIDKKENLIRDDAQISENPEQIFCICIYVGGYGKYNTSCIYISRLWNLLWKYWDYHRNCWKKIDLLNVSKASSMDSKGR